MEALGELLYISPLQLVDNIESMEGGITVRYYDEMQYNTETEVAPFVDIRVDEIGIK